MKKTLFSLLIAVLLVSYIGCDNPGPIQVIRDDFPQPSEVSLLMNKENDTLVVSESSYDFTGLLNDDEEKNAGTILVNGVRSDFGDSNVEFSYSRVMLRDKNSPISISGRFGRYDADPRLDAGTVRVNGTMFSRYEAIIQIRSLSSLYIPAGVFYKLVSEKNEASKEFAFRPISQYSIDADGKGPISPFVERIVSPAEVRLTDPKPNALVFRDEDLIVRWKGEAGQSVAVIIALFDDNQKVPGKPLMKLVVPAHANSLLVPSKLLQLIPKTSEGRYVFTIISSNVSDNGGIAGYSGKVLVQSSSIHNVSVLLR
jgi:hypothetical protein